MAGFTTKDFILQGQNQVLAAPSTQAVTNPFKISENDSTEFRARLKASATSGTVNVKLQHSWNGGTDWADVSGATVVAADGTGAQITTTGPLFPLARIVADGAGSTTLEEIWITRRT